MYTLFLACYEGHNDYEYKQSGIKGLPSKPCPTCNDGVQNQGESGIDCGGPCTTCGKKLILLQSE